MTYNEINIKSLDWTIKKLEQKNVQVIIVWVWTVYWWYIPIWFNASWWTKYKFYKWKQVVSKLNENNLKEIAKNWKTISYIRYENISKSSKLENLIIKNTKKVNLVKLGTPKNITRELVFISLILFILFLWLEYIEHWKK